jgi:hypothetical protein
MGYFLYQKISTLHQRVLIKYNSTLPKKQGEKRNFFENFTKKGGKLQNSL